MNKKYLLCLFTLSIWAGSCNSNKTTNIHNLLTQDSNVETIQTIKPVTAKDSLTKDENELINLSEDILRYIPKGYVVMDTASGDANGDSRLDMIILLKRIKEDSLINGGDTTLVRPFLIVTLEQDNGYKVAVRNDHILYKPEIETVDPSYVHDLQVDNGSITLTQGIMGGPQHWEQTFIFRYNKTKTTWYLFQQIFHSYTPNPIVDDNADAMIEHQKIKTPKQFGVISIEKFRINNFH